MTCTPLLRSDPPPAPNTLVMFSPPNRAEASRSLLSTVSYGVVAVAGAEVGVLFCTLGLVTGPIWAKGTWGHWWAWDPRLTVTLLLWFIYLAYLLLRSFTEGSTRTARFAAVYGIAGIAVIPLNYFAIQLFGGAAMHPNNLERGSLGTGMGWPFAAGVVTALLAMLHLVLLRIDLENKRIAANANAAEWDSDEDF